MRTSSKSAPIPLKRFDHRQCSKMERGVVLAYLRRTSGYSRPQITRLVAR